jgi:hypothetical protein
VKDGGILLSVHSDSSDDTKRAKEILERTGAKDISSTGEARGDKTTVTETEMGTLDDLSARKDISKTAVLRQALRLYQVIEERLARGEKLYFEQDNGKDKAELMML